MTNSKVLVLGNVLNQCYSNKSWKRLLQGILLKHSIPGITINNTKPFPLAFEEIILAAKVKGIHESTIKQEIAEYYNSLTSGDLHQEFIDLFQIILTDFSKNTPATSDVLRSELTGTRFVFILSCLAYSLFV
jgi:hypothetical protein